MSDIQHKAALPKDLKRKNRREILKVFQNSDKEIWSLAEVSEHTGISRATVTKAVLSFVEKNILLYYGKGSSTDVGGKKPDLFAFNREYQFIAYLNIEPGRLTMAFLDLKLKERGKASLVLPGSSDVGELLDKSRFCYEKLQKETGIGGDKLFGLSISTSGMINQETGVLQCTLAYPYWGSEIPLRDIFEQEFPGLVIMVENIARAAGRAELYYNREFEDKKVFTVFTNRGISGCLMERGRVQNSPHSLIGEVGHMMICPEDREVCRCGSRGCFEQLVLEKRILKTVSAHPDRWKESSLPGGRKLGLRDILTAANEGDAYACELTDQAARYFSIAIRNIILTVDPEIFVIQGIYAAGGDYFIKKIKEYLYHKIYFPRTSDWTIQCNERSIWTLAEIGLAAAMTDELFQNTEAIPVIGDGNQTNNQR